MTAERIRNTPIEKKVNFLRSRGLTDHEIQLSLQQAAAIYNDNKHFHVNSPVGHNLLFNAFYCINKYFNCDYFF